MPDSRKVVKQSGCVAKMRPGPENHFFRSDGRLEEWRSACYECPSARKSNGRNSADSGTNVSCCVYPLRVAISANISASIFCVLFLFRFYQILLFGKKNLSEYPARFPNWTSYAEINCRAGWPDNGQGSVLLSVGNVYRRL
jgi:hypothetical protein